MGAVDWGGTWIRVALVVDGRIAHRERHRRPAPLDAQYDLIAAALRDGAAAVGAKPAAVGVAIAGIVQGDVVASAVNVGIRRPTPVGAELRARLRPAGVLLMNDTQAAAAALAARWPDELVAVISMGTGLGGAVLDRGRLLLGRGAAGDVGHSVVEVGGRACPCGGRGCLERYASGSALDEAAEALASSGQSPLLASRRHTRPVHAGDLDEAARAGDPRARRVLDEAAAYLATGVRNAVAHLDPHRIALAGTPLAPDTLLGRALRERWAALRPAWSAVVLEHIVNDSDTTLTGAAAALTHTP